MTEKQYNMKKQILKFIEWVLFAQTLIVILVFTYFIVGSFIELEWVAMNWQVIRILIATWLLVSLCGYLSVCGFLSELDTD